MRLSFFWKSVIALATLLVVFVIIIAPIANAFDQQAQRADHNSAITTTLQDTSSEAILVDVKMTSIDYPTATYKVHIAVGPATDNTSNLFDNNGFPKVAFNLFFSENTFTFSAGRPLAPFDMTLNFASGDTSYYPFDTWTDELYVEAWITTNTTIQTIPLFVQFTGNIPITSVGTTWGNSSAIDVVLLQLTVERSVSTRGFSIFIVILMWLLSLATAGVAYEILICGREVQPPNMAATAALLFAIVNVRNAQPGVPPVGILIDVCGYFWNVALIALSTFFITSIWVYRWAPKDPPKQEVKKDEKVEVAPDSKNTVIDMKP